jgi:hypothetical protein
MSYSFFFGVNTPGAVIALLIGTLITILLLFLLISVIETVVLQSLRWGNFRQCIKASLVMNAVSSIVSLVLTILVQRPALWGLLVAWGLSVLIEGWVLRAIRREPASLNWLVAVAANLVSYLLLILPAYLFAQS